MGRYFFDLFNSAGWLADSEGMELADKWMAYTKAVSFIRELVAEEANEGSEINLAHFIAVRDEAGEEVFRVHFRDAVHFGDEPPDA